MNDRAPKKHFNDFVFTDLVPTLKQKIRESRFPPPVYNSISHKIEFAGVEVQIPYDSDQDSLCRALFKDEMSCHKEWSWDELIEQWGEGGNKRSGWRTVYNAGREINNKVAAETTVKDLLLVRKLTIALNPKYVG